MLDCPAKCLTFEKLLGVEWGYVRRNTYMTRFCFSLLSFMHQGQGPHHDQVLHTMIKCSQKAELETFDL